MFKGKPVVVLDWAPPQSAAVTYDGERTLYPVDYMPSWRLVQSKYRLEPTWEPIHENGRIEWRRVLVLERNKASSLNSKVAALFKKLGAKAQLQWDDKIKTTNGGDTFFPLLCKIAAANQRVWIRWIDQDKKGFVQVDFVDPTCQPGKVGHVDHEATPGQNSGYVWETTEIREMWEKLLFGSRAYGQRDKRGPKNQPHCGSNPPTSHKRVYEAPLPSIMTPRGSPVQVPVFENARDTRIYCEANEPRIPHDAWMQLHNIRLLACNENHAYPTSILQESHTVTNNNNPPCNNMMICILQPPSPTHPPTGQAPSTLTQPTFPHVLHGFVPNGMMNCPHVNSNSSGAEVHPNVEQVTTNTLHPPQKRQRTDGPVRSHEEADVVTTNNNVAAGAADDVACQSEYSSSEKPVHWDCFLDGFLGSDGTLSDDSPLSDDNSRTPCFSNEWEE